jgi:hypothetical protein
MQELTVACEGILRERGFSDTTLSKIKDSLRGFGLVPDFEALLTILQSFALPEREVRAAGPLTAYLAHSLSDWIPPLKEPAQDVVELKRLLTEKCSKVKMDDATRHYDGLFSILGEIKSIPYAARAHASLQGGAFLQSRGINVRTQDIFTTNYDIIIEQYFDCEGMRESLRTGFIHQAVRSIWNPKESYVWDDQRSRSTNLVKLHGSIDQFITTAGIEKRQAPPSQGYYASEMLEEMMIFPVHEKYATRSPYFDLFSLLRERLSHEPVCIVIGFSFRDEAVNNAFIDAINTNRNLKLIYVGSERANENIQRIPQIAKRTKVIPLSFGVHDECINQIKSALETWYPT